MGTNIGTNVNRAQKVCSFSKNVLAVAKSEKISIDKNRTLKVKKMESWRMCFNRAVLRNGSENHSTGELERVIVIC